jgi:hypothetical protein
VRLFSLLILTKNIEDARIRPAIIRGRVVR